MSRRRKVQRNSPSKRFSKLDIDKPGTEPAPPEGWLPAAPPKLKRFAKLDVEPGAAPPPGRAPPLAPARRFAKIEPDPAGAGTGDEPEPHRRRARKEIPPTPTQFEAYQTMFDHFNRELFKGELPQVILNFSRHSGALGFFARERWIGAKPDVTAHEISLNPDYLRERPPIQVASTLVHEMVHLWQVENGTPSRAGYHNNEWAQKMIAIGLHPSDTGSPGGRITGQRMTHYILPGGPFQASFDRLNTKSFPWQHIARTEPGPAGPPTRPGGEPEPPEPPTGPKAKNKVKYTCPACGLAVWGKPGLAVACLRDVQPLIEA